jgi:pimeloyl-ACP methyl ester carboxylesterase
MGAMVATRITRLHPELVSGLVLINMPSLYNEERSDREILRELPLPQRAYVSPLGKMLHITRESKIAKAVPRILYPKNQDMQDIITDSLTHTRTSLIRSLRNTILKYDPLEDMREIDIETMYIYSTEDRYFSRPVLETILTLPDVKTIELAGGHQLPIRQAEAIARIIRSGL